MATMVNSIRAKLSVGCLGTMSQCSALQRLLQPAAAGLPFAP